MKDKEPLSVSFREERIDLNTTDTVTFDHSDLDITVFSPEVTPRVFNEPVVLAGCSVGAMTDSKDGVIKLCTTTYIVQNTGGVVSEAILVSLNGHSSGLLSYSGLHLGHI